MQFEASRPSDYRTSSSHVLEFARFLDPRDSEGDHKTPFDQKGASRALFRFPELSSAFFALDEGEYFQTFLVNLSVRTGHAPSVAPAQPAARYQVGTGVDYTIETAAPGTVPVPSGSTSSQPPPLPGTGPGFANSSSRLRSDVSVLDGLERVWRSWFDEPGRTRSLSDGFGELAVGSDTSRLPSLRKVEIDSMTVTVATYPSIPFQHDPLATSTTIARESAREAGHRRAAEAMGAVAGDGQRLFEMSWQDLECDVARILVALEDADRARSVVGRPFRALLLTNRRRSRAVVMYSSLNGGLVRIV